MTHLRRFFDDEPESWQDLELRVQQAFAEMGYESHRDYALQTVRGTVRIDVYAVKHSTPIPTIVVCECKHWKKPVDQAVVFTVRSVCADTGAHFGLIISKVGFQPGAEETRTATNVHLLDFTRFQETFFAEWRTGMFMKLVQLAEPLRPLLFNRFSGKAPALEERLKGVNVVDKYAIYFGEANYSAFFVDDGEFPLDTYDPRGDPKVLRPITIVSHRHFYEVSAEGVADARRYFAV